jgi:hypothetical protein
MTGSSEEAVRNDGIRIVPADEETAASCVTADKSDAYAFLSARAPKSASRARTSQNLFKAMLPVEVKRGRCSGLTILPPSVSRLSRQCGILTMSQPYSLLRPVTGVFYF